MGQEARCTVRHRRRSIEGKALLESSEIHFRGDDLRLKIPFAEIASIKVSNGALQLKTAEGLVSFDLGAAAPKWAEKILHPKPVIDKLGVKPGMVVSMVGAEDPELARQARERSATVSVGRASRDSDLVFLFTESATKLGRLKTLRDTIRPNGAIWVVWPKGRPQLKEDHIRAAGKPAGLVDVKVVAFSPTQSALKLVIPIKSR